MGGSIAREGYAVTPVNAACVALAAMLTLLLFDLREEMPTLARGIIIGTVGALIFGGLM
jgi:hypothetical protein